MLDALQQDEPSLKSGSSGAYNALDQAITRETLNFSRWTYVTGGVLAGTIGGLVVLVIPLLL